MRLAQGAAPPKANTHTMKKPPSSSATLGAGTPVIVALRASLTMGRA
jgi:hypothetical protein